MDGVEIRGGVLYPIDRLGCGMPWLLVVLLCIVLLGRGLVDRWRSRSRNRGMTSEVSGEKKQLNPFLIIIPLGGMTRDDSP